MMGMYIIKCNTHMTVSCDVQILESVYAYMKETFSVPRYIRTLNKMNFGFIYISFNNDE